MTKTERGRRSALHRFPPLRLLMRGLLLRCPYCGKPTFARGLLRVHERCSVCGLVFEHDDGFFLGALIVNYTLTALIGILPALVLVATGRWGVPAAMIYAVVMCVLLPILFYWHAKSMWMAVFYCFVPEDLEPEGTAWRASATDHEETDEELREAIAALEGGRRPGRSQRSRR